MASYARWNYVFSYREGSVAAAAVSYARMDPRNLGSRENEDLLEARLRKMVGKDISILVYGPRMTDDPSSLKFLIQSSQGWSDEDGDAELANHRRPPRASIFHCHSAAVVAVGNRCPVWRATMTICPR
jgi:hypothetical protein